ncbi:mavicyanin-like [Melia azedarach]|uniref:Mavicyanin-like n=1 Tax=Melia azedarach TaxID=155640 RepID=A0ACC1Z2G3_MELAZ|nr:mavicyanin-like [Melia azedarach]
MALAKSMLAFLLMTTLVGVSLGAVHKVGDSAGWTIMGNIDYDKWAASKDFHVGDTIVFEYDNQFHNTKQVTLQDFQSCNALSPIAAYATGSDSIILKTPGHYYFLCGYPGHCEAGQKLDIMVTPPSPRPTSASPRPAAPYASSPSATASSSQTPPNNPDYQSNASSSLQILLFKLIWPALINLAIFFVTAEPGPRPQPEPEFLILTQLPQK